VHMFHPSRPAEGDVREIETHRGLSPRALRLTLILREMAVAALATRGMPLPSLASARISHMRHPLSGMTRQLHQKAQPPLISPSALTVRRTLAGGGSSVRTREVHLGALLLIPAHPPTRSHKRSACLSPTYPQPQSPAT
jgi:hypothetical protein